MNPRTGPLKIIFTRRKVRWRRVFFKKNGALLLNNYAPTIPISISSLEKLRKKKGS